MSKDSIRKKLQSKAEKLWKEYCLQRDGRECQVKKHFPNLKITHTNIYQVDHCISRMNKHTFIDVSNGTVVCSACNMAKGFGNKSVHRAIDEIVRKREGIDIYNRLVLQDQEMGPNLNWKNIEWLELQIKVLKELIAVQEVI